MPDGSVFLPEDNKKLLSRALEIVEAATISQSIRAAWSRQFYALSDSGRGDGTKSKANLLYGHLDQLSSHLFATGGRLTIDAENEYPKNKLEEMRVAAKVITQDFERTNTDMMFAAGVFESLRYGSAFLKQWVEEHGSGTDRHATYHSALVMPWCMGVTNERNNSLERQDAICETLTLTLPEVWRRIYHLPDAEALFRRIQSNAKKGEAGEEANSFFHQVLSTSTLNTGIQGMTRPVPGGIVQLNNDPNYAILGPAVGVDLVKMYELWINNGDDRVCVQIVEPDIMISPTPYTRVSNLLISGAEHSGLHPYTRICANDNHGWMWGRSELSDLTEPQGLVSTGLDDLQRMFGLQIDKILAFAGMDGLNDETYDQFRGAGYVNMGDNGKVTDLTPPFPPEMLPVIQFYMNLIPTISGFNNVLNGQGQPGVRSGDQMETLKQLASPRLLDRSLLVERQYAAAADLRLSLHEAKDAQRYWWDKDHIDETRFTLADLPDDRRVSVDSHSTSPVFKNMHEQKLAFALTRGVIDAETYLELSDLPMKDILITKAKEKAAAQAALLKELATKDPEGFEKLLTHQKKR